MYFPHWPTVWYVSNFFSNLVKPIECIFCKIHFASNQNLSRHHLFISIEQNAIGLVLGVPQRLSTKLLPPTRQCKPDNLLSPGVVRHFTPGHDQLGLVRVDQAKVQAALVKGKRNFPGQPVLSPFLDREKNTAILIEYKALFGNSAAAVLSL